MISGLKMRPLSNAPTRWLIWVCRSATVPSILSGSGGWLASGAGVGVGGAARVRFGQVFGEFRLRGGEHFQLPAGGLETLLHLELLLVAERIVDVRLLAVRRAAVRRELAGQFFHLRDQSQRLALRRQRGLVGGGGDLAAPPPP